MSIISLDDERRLRELAAGLAKDIEDADKLVERLGFTRQEYNELADTRMFKSILGEAISEWQGANNTHKRIKLKAAINIEQALPSFYQAMVKDDEPLSSRVKAFEAVARVGGLGNPELVPAGGGQFFKLEINLGDRREMLTLGTEPEEIEPTRSRQGLSKVFDGVEVGDW